MASRHPPPHGQKQKTYVVFRGRVPEIYESWLGCQMQVDGFSGQAHQAFSSRAEAETAWANYFCRTTTIEHVMDAVAAPVSILAGMGDENMNF